MFNPEKRRNRVSVKIINSILNNICFAMGRLGCLGTHYYHYMTFKL